MKSAKQRESSAISTPDKRLEAVTEVIEILARRVKDLVTSTTVKAMRLG